VSRYTSVGCGLWDWPRWGPLSLGARNLWLALYTSPEAKRMPPGLWHGGVGTLADAARVELVDALDALDELTGCGLVVHDPHRLVGRAVRGWWGRWETVPACEVRDAHVELLRWLLEPMTADHQKAWDDTFGTKVGNGRANGSGNGPGYGPADRTGNGIPIRPAPFVDAHIANRSGDGSLNGSGNGPVPDPEQDQDQGEEIQEGRDADGSRDRSGNGSLYPLDSLAPQLARALAWTPPDSRDARRVEAARSASLGAERVRR
jgi:hypothetical protein